MTSPAARHASDTAELTELVAAYSAAIGAKDARAVVGFYAPDVVAYDLAPPLRTRGREVRDPASLQQWFDAWEGAIGNESRELEIAAGDGVAYACALRHLTGKKKDGETIDLWFRATACFKRDAGTWKITHVHDSVPFAMDGSGQALLDLTP